MPLPKKKWWPVFINVGFDTGQTHDWQHDVQVGFVYKTNVSLDTLSWGRTTNVLA